MKYKIEHNVPLPTGRFKRPESSKYPFYDMEIGDSFAISSDKQAKVATIVTNLHNTGDMRFTVRRVSMDKARVWRIK